MEKIVTGSLAIVLAPLLIAYMLLTYMAGSEALIYFGFNELVAFITFGFIFFIIRFDFAAVILAFLGMVLGWEMHWFTALLLAFPGVFLMFGIGLFGLMAHLCKKVAQ